MKKLKNIKNLFTELENRLEKKEFNLNASIVDCHIHTNYSDAIDYTVEDLLTDIYKKNRRVFSVTEHDNFNSAKIIQNSLNEADYTYLVGVELSTNYTSAGKMHIKGFLPEIPDKNSRIYQYCRDTCIKRKERIQKVISIFNELFIQLKVPNFWDEGILKISLGNLSNLLGKQQIGEDGEILPAFYNTYIISSYITKNIVSLNPKRYQNFAKKFIKIFELETLRKANFYHKNVKNDYNHLLSDKKADWNSLIEHLLLLPDSRGYKPVCCIDEPNPLTPNEAIALIKEDGGIAELAHPCETYGKNINLIEKDVKGFAFDGIEVYSPKNYPCMIPGLRKIALNSKLYCGFGSDTHGFITKGKRDLGDLVMKRNFDREIK